MGPNWVALSCGLPTTKAWHCCTIKVSASASSERGTNKREGALQLCPVLLIMPRTLTLMARGKSQSGSKILGDLPPNSRATRLIVGAASVLTETPARLDPVSDTRSMRGSEDSKGPTLSPWPKIMLNTPVGAPAEIGRASCRKECNARGTKD